MIETRYCQKCGKKMLTQVKIDSYNRLHGTPEYRIFYKCQESRWFNKHDSFARFSWTGEIEALG